MNRPVPGRLSLVAKIDGLKELLCKPPALAANDDQRFCIEPRVRKF